MSPTRSTGRLTSRVLRKLWSRMLLLQASHPDILSNPGAYWATGLFGGTRTLHLKDGTALLVSRDNLRMVTNILLLAYYGARFSGPRSQRHIWRLSVEDGIIETPSGIRFTLESLEANIFAETFIYDLHQVPGDLHGKVVVDVGAHVGDTALYFAAQGATVYALEPDPMNFRRLLRNLELNPGLAQAVRPIEKAVGRDGKVVFRSGLRGGSGRFARQGTPTEVDSLSLTQLLSEFHIERPYLLKLDCKGSEFEIVRDPALARFERLSIEYNTDLGVGTLDQLVTALEAQGFPGIRTAKFGWGPEAESDMGLLHAERTSGVPSRS